PATQVRRRSAPLVGHFGQELPQAAAQPCRPFVPRRLERLFQGLGQLRRRWLRRGLLVHGTDEPGGGFHQALRPDIGENYLLVHRLLRGSPIPLDDIPHIEFEPPTVVALLGDTPQFQRADLGRPRRQGDRHPFGATALAAPQDGVQRRQLQQLLRRHLQERTGRILAAYRGREQR